MNNIAGGGTSDLLPKKKQHKKSKTGAKANKKKKQAVTENDRKHNPKAFNVANIGRTKKTQQRNLDRMQKKELVPLIDRTADEVEAPPAVIVVMGPKGSN